MFSFTAQKGFALLCALGMVAILTGAALEITRFRRGGIVPTRQFRLRMISACIWLLILGGNLYAALALWPQGGTSPEAREQVRRFSLVVLGSFSLIVIALALWMYDLWELARQRRQQEAQFNQDLIALARAEASRLNKDKREEQDG